jgi:hypothetical protein
LASFTYVTVAVTYSAFLVDDFVVARRDVIEVHCPYLGMRDTRIVYQ